MKTTTLKTLSKETDAQIKACLKPLKIKLSKYYDEDDVKSIPTLLDDIIAEAEFAGCPIFRDCLNGAMTAGDRTIRYAIEEVIGYIDSWFTINENKNLFDQVSDVKTFTQTLIQYIILYLIHEDVAIVPESVEDIAAKIYTEITTNKNKYGQLYFNVGIEEPDPAES